MMVHLLQHRAEKLKRILFRFGEDPQRGDIPHDIALPLLQQGLALLIAEFLAEAGHVLVLEAYLLRRKVDGEDRRMRQDQRDGTRALVHHDLVERQALQVDAGLDVGGAGEEDAAVADFEPLALVPGADRLADGVFDRPQLRGTAQHGEALHDLLLERRRMRTGRQQHQQCRQQRGPYAGNRHPGSVISTSR